MADQTFLTDDTPEDLFIRIDEELKTNLTSEPSRG